MRTAKIFLTTFLVALLCNVALYSQSDTVYTVIVSSMKYPKNAAKVAQKLEKMGFNVQILKMDTPIGEMYRVCVDKSIDRDGAKTTNGNVINKAKVGNAWILKIDDYSEVVENSKDVNNVTKFGKSETVANKYIKKKSKKANKSQGHKNSYVLVLSSSKNLPASQAFAKKLQAQGIEAQVFKMNTSKGEYHRVCTPEKDGHSKAKEYQKELGDKNLDSWILPVDDYEQLVLDNIDINLESNNVSAADKAKQKALAIQKAKKAKKVKLAAKKTAEARLAAQKAAQKTAEAEKAKQAKIAAQKTAEAEKAKQTKIAAQKTADAEKVKQAKMASQKTAEAEKAKRAKIAVQKTAETEKAKQAKLAAKKTAEAKRAKQAKLAAKKPVVSKPVETIRKANDINPSVIDDSGLTPEENIAIQQEGAVDVAVATPIIPGAEIKKPEIKKVVPSIRKSTDTIPNTNWTYGQFYEKLKVLCYAIEKFDSASEVIVQQSIDTIYGTYLQAIQENLITSKRVKKATKILKNYSINRNINDFYRELYKIRRLKPKYTEIPTYDSSLSVIPGTNIFIYEYNGNIGITQNHLEAMEVRNWKLTEEEKEEILISGISINVGVAIGGAKFIKAMYFSIEKDMLFLRAIDLINPYKKIELDKKKEAKQKKLQAKNDEENIENNKVIETKENNIEQNNVSKGSENVNEISKEKNSD